MNDCGWGVISSVLEGKIELHVRISDRHEQVGKNGVKSAVKIVGKNVVQAWAGS